MKTLKILAAFLFFTGVVVAQDMNATDVPASVKNAFSKEYAQATDVEWEKDMENYKVEFDLNKMENEVWYSASGAVVKKEQDITEAELPQTVRDAVKSGYADYTLDDKLKGLDLGADDYLPKPFHMAELRARMKAVLRRRNFEGHTELQFGNVSINTSNRTLFIEKEEVELNRKEYDVLLYLASNKDRLVNKTALAEHVWGDNIDQADSFDFIYSQIKNLRKKLETQKADIEIKAVYGMGYKLMEK